MRIELTPFEVIHAEGALRDAYLRHVAHYAESGCPGIMKDTVEEHLDSQRAAHKKLVDALRAEGYVMRNSDLDPVDHKALMALPWTPPPHKEKTA